MKRIAVDLPNDLAAVVEAEAERRSTTLSEVVRDAVVASLVGGEGREVPFAGVCHHPEPVRSAEVDSALGETWEDDPRRSLEGTVRVVGDIVSPALPEEAWEALRESPGPSDEADTD